MQLRHVTSEIRYIIRKNVLLFFCLLCELITPRACTRGKVIGLYVCHHRYCRHKNRQISRSKHLKGL